ncbi:MAG: radical SAM protein [Campylobacterota bacterium]|nr:radical SAM protein [Campylobacterota bacterium]
MMISHLTKKCQELQLLLKSCVCRNFNDFFIVLDWRRDRYLFFEDLALRIISDIAEIGCVDIGFLLEKYDVTKENLCKDIECFLFNTIDFFKPSNIPEGTDKGLVSEEYIFSLAAKKLIPLTATIEITEKCNESCIHCYRPDLDGIEVWDESTFKLTCEQLKDLGTVQIDFTGGEPFAKENFINYVKICSKMNFAIGLLTNGTLLSETIIEELSLLNIRMIYISLYGSTSKSHDVITNRRGSFKKTIESILAIKQKGLPLTINSPIMRQNQNEVENIKKFCVLNDIEVKFTFKITNSYKTKKNTKALNIFSEKLISRYINNPNVLLYKELIKSKKRNGFVIPEHVCDTGFRSLTISPHGDIIPCTALRFTCGNIKNESLSDIWYNSKQLKYWRKTGSLVSDTCKKCPAYFFCEPCPADYFSENSSFEGVDETTCKFGKALANCVYKL